MGKAMQIVWQIESLNKNATKKKSEEHIFWVKFQRNCLVTFISEEEELPLSWVGFITHAQKNIQDKNIICDGKWAAQQNKGWLIVRARSFGIIVCAGVCIFYY